MASACVKGAGASPEPFLDLSQGYSSYGWLSPRASFSRDSTESKSKVAGEKTSAAAAVGEEDFLDFEFRLGDPATMLTADELFSNGKLVPLQLAAARSVAETPSDVRSPEPREPWRRTTEPAVTDVYTMSPRAPTCSSRWRELLRLRKIRGSKPENNADKPTAACKSTSSSAAKSFKLLLQRNAKSSSTVDVAMNLPLLHRDADPESLICISSRLSHSSSSSSSAADHDELPRLSLDAEKHCRHPARLRISRQRSDGTHQHQQQIGRVGRSTARRAAGAPVVPPPRSASVDSPRMNSSGKVIFQGLGRSSSSPSSLNGGGNGGQRVRYPGMEFTPVLNVPVFGLGQLFSAQKKDKERDCNSSSTAPPPSKGSNRSRIEKERSLGGGGKICRAAARDMMSDVKQIGC